MPTDYSQNGKARNARHLARELETETEQARAGRRPFNPIAAAAARESARAALGNYSPEALADYLAS